MGAPILLQDGKMESDLDANFHRIINLDTSNLPPSGQPPTIHPPTFQWLHDWDATTGQWTATQPNFININGTLTFDQQTAINFLGEIQTGVWHAFPIEPAYLPTLDLIQSPAATVSMGGFRITQLADPINPQDAVNKNFMDLLLLGLNPKQAVRVATTTSIGISGLITVDNITLNVGDRVLVKNQTGLQQYRNGIYTAATGTWPRATDCDHGSGDAGYNSANSINQAYCVVMEGTVNTGTSWFQTANIVTIANVANLENFVIFSQPLTLIAGQGLGQIGNQLFVNYTPNRTMATGDAIDIASTYVGQTSITTLGVVTGGTWHANIIDSAHGGTGTNNGANNITLEGAFAVTLGLGAISSTLEFVVANGATSLILPTTGTLSTLAGTEILQNKRVLKKYAEIASNAVPSINTNLVDVFSITNLNIGIASMTTNLTGNQTDGQELVIWIHDNGIAQTITWGAKFTAGIGLTDPTLPTITTAGKWMHFHFMWLKQLSQFVLTNKLTSV